MTEVVVFRFYFSSIESRPLLRVALVNEAPPRTLLDFDGLRFDYADWWINIRPSNTEPYLRVVMEADTLTRLTERRTRVEGLLAPFVST